METLLNGLRIFGGWLLTNIGTIGLLVDGVGAVILAAPNLPYIRAYIRSDDIMAGKNRLLQSRELYENDQGFDEVLLVIKTKIGWSGDASVVRLWNVAAKGDHVQLITRIRPKPNRKYERTPSLPAARIAHEYAHGYPPLKNISGDIIHIGQSQLVLAWIDDSIRRSESNRLRYGAYFLIFGFVLQISSIM